MHEYIPTHVFRQYLSLLAAATTLPELANLTIGGTTREFTVLHKLELQGYPQIGLIEPQLIVTSWAIENNDEASDEKSEIVDAERAWALEGVFWVGAPKRIYRDSNPVADKRWGGFSWCGNSERELVFPTFRLIKDGPLFTTTLRLASLMLYSPTIKISKPVVNVGSVDEAGVVTPAVASLVAAPSRSESDVSSRVEFAQDVSLLAQKEQKATGPGILERIGKTIGKGYPYSKGVVSEPSV